MVKEYMNKLDVVAMAKDAVGLAASSGNLGELQSSGSVRRVRLAQTVPAGKRRSCRGTRSECGEW